MMYPGSMLSLESSLVVEPEIYRYDSPMPIRAGIPVPQFSSEGGGRNCNVEFLGWKFDCREWEDECGPHLQVLCFYVLHNPEKEGKIWSYRNASTIQIYEHRSDSSDVDQLTWACVWLVAHWWDHYAASCPCITKENLLSGGKKSPWFSNFGHGIYRSLIDSGATAKRITSQ